MAGKDPPDGNRGLIDDFERRHLKMKKLICMLTALTLMLTALCGMAAAEEKTFKIGICNYVDHASLNQIVENLQARLEEISTEKNVRFDVRYQNCNADANLMNQIIADFADVDLMVGVATPVAMAMQAATEDSGIPVVFAAVSDPLAVGLVESLVAPGANVTGTSDFLNSNAVLNLIFALNPGAKKVALLYDLGQDASATPVAAARKFLEEKGVSYREYNGTNTVEVQQAAESIVADGMDAVFTPTDNTIMSAELAIAETLMEAKIPHYTGADSFALNGAFLGYGVDYASLGRETADMVAEILVDGRKPAEVPVKMFDNGTATVNNEVLSALGLTFDQVSGLFAPYCTRIVPIDTAEEFK